MNNAHGVVIIGTKLDTTGFEKGISDLGKKAEKKKAEIEITTTGIEQSKKELEELENQRDEIVKKYEEIMAIQGKIQELESKTPDERTPKEDNELATYSLMKTEKILQETDKEWDKIVKQIEKAKEKINNQNSTLAIQQEQYQKILDKVEEIKEKEKQTKLDQIIKGINGVKSGIKDVVKNVGRWVLTVFSLSTAYSLITQAVSTLSRYDDKLATDIEYIRWVMANILKPVIEKIVELVIKLVSYIVYIGQMWGLISKKADLSNKAFNENNKSLEKSVKNAKELNKQLAGFDEMNILSDTSGSGADTSGGSGATLPSFDISKLQGDVPGWIRWIGENGELILAIIGGITAALISLKLLGLDPIVSLGIGIAVAGLILLIQDIIKFIQDPSWEGFANILADLAMLLTGVSIAMIAVNASNPIGWITLAISAILALASAIIKYRDEIKRTLLNVVTWISVKIINPIVNFFSNLASKIRTIISTLILNIKTFFLQIPSFINGIIDKIVTGFKNLGKKAGEVIGNAFKTVVNGILKTIEDVLNAPIKAINKLLDKINDVPGINLTKLSTLKLPRLARGGIINMPGRGIPVGSAIAGERGREAVLPLTDTQQMQLLGEAIGRYININATIPIQIGNRQVAREIKRINAEDDFAFNR